MSYTVEEIFARETSKVLSRDVYGIVHKIPVRHEVTRILIKAMVLDLLEDEDINNFLTNDEQSRLEGLIIMKS